MLTKDQHHAYRRNIRVLTCDTTTNALYDNEKNTISRVWTPNKYP